MQLNKVSMALPIALAALVTGCAYTADFSFPYQQGDVLAGRQAFLDHRCHQCHSIAGERLPPLAGASRPILELGGATTVIRSYGALMTSIINPNHAISERYREQLLQQAEIPTESPMPVPQIDNMTVRQLIDLVAFLDSRYRLIETYE